MYYTDIFFLKLSIFLLIKTVKEALRYLFNVIILFDTVFYLKLNFKLKIDPKRHNLKNLEEILKTWGKFAKKMI